MVSPEEGGRMLRVEQACVVWLVLIGLVGVGLVVVFS